MLLGCELMRGLPVSLIFLLPTSPERFMEEAGCEVDPEDALGFGLGQEVG